MKTGRIVIASILFLLLSFWLVMSQIQIEQDKIQIVPNCAKVKMYYNTTEGIIKYVEPYSKGDLGIIYNHTVVGTKQVTHYDVETRCKPYTIIDGEILDYLKSDYNCTYNDKDLICDSCRDGNCDGKCDPNGGETCLKIDENRRMIYKNSQVEWGNDMNVPVKKINEINDNKPTIELNPNEGFEK